MSKFYLDAIKAMLGARNNSYYLAKGSMHLKKIYHYQYLVAIILPKFEE